MSTASLTGRVDGEPPPDRRRRRCRLSRRVAALLVGVRLRGRSPNLHLRHRVWDRRRAGHDNSPAAGDAAGHPPRGEPPAAGGREEELQSG